MFFLITNIILFLGLSENQQVFPSMDAFRVLLELNISPLPSVSKIIEPFGFQPSKKYGGGPSLVVQWWRIHLPMQGTRVQALVREDPTCCGATKPMCHNYWVCALEPASRNYWAHVPQLLKPTHLEPVLYSKRSHCNEKPVHHNKE